MIESKLKEKKPDGDMKNRLGSLISDHSTNIQKSAHDLKESLKRPLTGLLRRPGSRGGGKRDKEESILKKTDLDKAISMSNESSIFRADDKATTLEVSETPKLVDLANLDKFYLTEPKHAVPVRLDAVNPKDAWMSKLDDIDLFLLSRFLNMEDEVKEEMVPWSWDYLFACVSVELRDEWAFEDEQFDEKSECL